MIKVICKTGVFVTIEGVTHKAMTKTVYLFGMKVMEKIVVAHRPQDLEQSNYFTF